MKKEKYITRKEASELLNISIRTLDRSIRRNELRTKHEGRNVFVHYEDVLRLQKNSSVEQEVLQKTPSFDIPPQQSLIDNTTDQSLLITKIFEEFRKQIEKKEEKIELLNYKLGQMEMKLKGSIPLLEYKESSKNVEKKVQEQDIFIESLSKKYRLLSVVKNIYLILLMTVIIAIPFIWLFLFKT